MPGRTAIPLTIASAWLFAILATLGGWAESVHHDALFEGDLEAMAAVGIAALVWQVHVLAMMLPSSLPMVRIFGRAAARDERPRTAMGAFVAGYLFVWGAFGATAAAGDLLLHRIAPTGPTSEGGGVVAAGVFLVAGAFQFSSLKERCLSVCRHPAAYLVRRYRRGGSAAFRFGIGHGLYCVGCCWALMLMLFSIGSVAIYWMAPFTALMWVERASARGHEITRPVGWALLVTGLLGLLASL